MKLNSENLETLCDTAIAAALEAGHMIQQRANTDFAVSHKEMGSTPASQVVTEVDLLSQEIILTHINPTLDQHNLGLLTEETPDNGSRFEKDYFWCIDPMDGTLPFIEQRPGYGVSIALVSQAGQSVIGVVYDPLTETLYHAVHSAGAFRNRDAWIIPVAQDKPAKSIASGGATLNTCWVLEQAPAYFLKKPKPEEGCGCIWDYAAMVCIYKELGVAASDSHGMPLELNPQGSFFMNQKGVLFCSHSEIQKDMINKLS